MHRSKLIAAALWDVRAQCEQQLRDIISAQKLIELYDRIPETPSDSKARLLAEYGSILATHAQVSDALAGWERAILALSVEAPPAGSPPPPTRK
jgi:hypothetical protein